MTDPSGIGPSLDGTLNPHVQRAAARQQAAMNGLPDPYPEGHVIAAFPATGKSYLAASSPTFVDSDSSRFSWVGEPRRRNPDWPANYVAHIREQLEAGKVVLVSTHAEVRQALRDARIPFALAYPDEGCKYEYLGRMRDRGSPTALIAMVERNWRDWISQLRLEPGRHYVLTSGQYLSGVVYQRRSHAA